MERPELTGPHALSHKTSEKTHEAVRLAARAFSEQRAIRFKLRCVVEQHWQSVIKFTRRN